MMKDATARIMRYASASGSSSFQPSAISWSKRNRGSVHRTQMNTKMKNRVFAVNTNIVSKDLYQRGSVWSQLVNGMSQPPKKSVAIIAEAVMRFAYSAMKNIENFIELYSV